MFQLYQCLLQQDLTIPLHHKWAIRAEEREGQNGDTITWHGKEQEEESASTSITLGYSLTNTGPSKAPALSKVWIQILY